MYNRPYYLKKVLNSLEKVVGIEDYKIMISVDFHKATRMDTKRVISEFKYADNIITKFHINKLGCAGNMKYCFDYAFEENDYDYMIHLEDDTPVAPDWLRWMLWAGEWSKDRDNIFAICPFTRKSSGSGDKRHTIEASTLKHGFDCAGGFGMHKSQWEYMKSLGGMFGIVGPAATKAPPDEWKAMQTITWDGSWAWPFRRFFCRDKLNLFCLINRANNIGAKEGRFNPGEQWHKDNIYVERWAAADEFKDMDWNTLEYKIPAGVEKPDDSDSKGPAGGW